MKSLYNIAEKTTKTITFDVESIKSFALLSGDLSPLHHNDDFAKMTQFKGLIVSGTQCAALMMGMVATFLTQRGSGLALEFDFKFLKAIPVNETVTIEWEITNIVFNKKLQGFLIELIGNIYHERGKTYVTGRSKCVSMLNEVISSQ